VFCRLFPPSTTGNCNWSVTAFTCAGCLHSRCRPVQRPSQPFHAQLPPAAHCLPGPSSGASAQPAAHTCSCSAVVSAYQPSLLLLPRVSTMQQRQLRLALQAWCHTWLQPAGQQQCRIQTHLVPYAAACCSAPARRLALHQALQLNLQRTRAVAVPWSVRTINQSCCCLGGSTAQRPKLRAGA
jgi:hypothetical protein